MDGWGIGSMVTEAMAPYQQHRDAMLRQHDAQGYNTQMFMNRYRMTVEDLKNAGLNPMLAYMQGPGASPTSPIGQGANFSTDAIGKGVAVSNQNRITSAQEANIKANTEKTAQDTKTSAANERNTDMDTLVKSGVPAFMAAQITNLNASAEQSKANVEMIQANIRQVDERIKEIQSQVEKNKSDVKLNNSLKELNMYRGALTVAETYLTNNRSQSVLLDNAILDPKAKAAKMATGQGAAIADNIGRIGKAAWQWMFPTIGGSDPGPNSYGR